MLKPIVVTAIDVAAVMGLLKGLAVMPSAALEEVLVLAVVMMVTVVLMAIVDVLSMVERAGQSVTSAAQLVTVTLEVE